MRELIQIPASVVGMSPRQDKSWRISFESRELSGDEVAVLADNFQGEGWLVYKANDDIKADEIPTGNAEPGTKTSSQRLRDVIFILYKQRGSKVDYETFYRTTMEQIIEFVKGKLEAEV